MSLLQRHVRILLAMPLIFRHPRGFLIPSHLTVAERVLLYRLTASVRSWPILEIGSYLGASAYFIAAASADGGRDTKVICVDTWQNDAMTEGARDTYTQFLINTQAYTDRIIPLRGFSHDVIGETRQLAPDGLGMLFVDGDHSWEGVKRDWDCYRPLLGPGALVVFHDFGWAEGVRRLVHDEVMPLVSKSGSLPNLWWGRMAQ